MPWTKGRKKRGNRVSITIEAEEKTRAEGLGRPNSRAILIAIGAVVLTSLFWASSDTAAQYLTRSLPALQIIFLRYVFHFALLLPVFRKGFRKTLKTQHFGLQILRGVFAALSGISFIIGLNFIPVADATAITFISPFVIMIAASFILKEHVGLSRWLAALVGLIGVLIIVQPGTDAFRWSALLPLAAAVCGAATLIITRMMPHENSMITMIYTGGIGVVLCGIAAVFVWKNLTLNEWGIAFCGGLFGALANFTQIWTYRRIPAAILAPFSYSQLIWASLLGFIVFGVWPNSATLLGALIIAASGIYSANRERVEAARHSA